MAALAPADQPAISTVGLAKRFRTKTALAGCTVTVPAGSICALVGSNGAGKTTLLRLLCGLSRPSDGIMSVLGHTPGQDPAFLARIGYLAQDIALWRRFSAAEHIRIGAHLNPRWDTTRATERLQALRIDLDRPVSTLSGGERAQLALSLALAKRPRVLLLDEPVAALDPLARRDFLATLAQAVAEGELTVLISSHLLGDLERICDHLILLAAGQTRLSGNVEQVLAGHRLLRGRRTERVGGPGVAEVIEARHTERESTLLVRVDGPIPDPRWDVGEVALEDIVLAYMSRDSARSTASLVSVGGAA
jgi:ABC-2 type transport system ATP-binding protein